MPGGPQLPPRGRACTGTDPTVTTGPGPYPAGGPGRLTFKAAAFEVSRMSLENGSDRGQLARIALAVVLALLAVRWLLRGKRIRGILAAVGALALGYTTATDVADLTVIDVETGVDEPELRCAICGDPIVPGQRRTPNEDGDPVHEDCLEATA